MIAPALPRAATIAPWGWAFIGLRLGLLLTALIVALPLYYACAPFGNRNPVPRQFLRLVGTIVGLRVRVRGACAENQAALIANHVSWLDIPALAGATGCAFVAHDGLEGIGPLRWLCERNGTVFVARHERRSVERQVAKIRTALTHSDALAIFPEGTTANGATLLPFKSSLLSALEDGPETLAVQPVWLDYGPAVHQIAWVGEEPGLANALRILARLRPIPLTVHILPPLDAEERFDRKRMASAARAAIETAMDRASAALRGP